MRNLQWLTYDFGKPSPRGAILALFQLALLLVNLPGNQINIYLYVVWGEMQKQSKKISNDQELIQSDPISCPQNQKGNN